MIEPPAKPDWKARARAAFARLRAYLAEGGAPVWRPALLATAGLLAIPAALYALDAFDLRNLVWELLFGLPFGPARAWRWWAGLAALLLLLGAPAALGLHALLKRPVRVPPGEFAFLRSYASQAAAALPALLLLAVAAAFAATAPAEDLFVGDVGIALGIAFGVAALMLRDQGGLREARLSASGVTLVGWLRIRRIALAEIGEARLRAGRVELEVGGGRIAVPAEELIPVADGARRAEGFSSFSGPLGAKGFAAAVRALAAEDRARRGA